MGDRRRVDDASPVETADPAARWDVATLLASFNQPGGLAESAAQQVADRARRDAMIRSRETLVDNFASTGPHAITKAAVRSGIPDPASFIEAATGRTTEVVLPVLR